MGTEKTKETGSNSIVLCMTTVIILIFALIVIGDQQAKIMNLAKERDLWKLKYNNATQHFQDLKNQPESTGQRRVQTLPLLYRLLPLVFFIGLAMVISMIVVMIRPKESNAEANAECNGKACAKFIAALANVESNAKSDAKAYAELISALAALCHSDGKTDTEVNAESKVESNAESNAKSNAKRDIIEDQWDHEDIDDFEDCLWQARMMVRQESSTT